MRISDRCIIIILSLVLIFAFAGFGFGMWVLHLEKSGETLDFSKIIAVENVTRR